jgi:DNA-binding MarR family transcriptional regulator
MGSHGFDVALSILTCEDHHVSSDPAVTVHQLATELGRSAERLLGARGGVSFAQYRVLRALRTDGAATQHALAERLGVGDAAVSRILPGLVAQGWCVVERDPDHARRRRVRLTAAGAALESDGAAFLAASFFGAARDAGVDGDAFVEAADALTRRLRSFLAPPQDPASGPVPPPDRSAPDHDR